MPNISAAKSRAILVFGAHPQDVEVAMAGTISRLVDAGNDVYVCIAPPDSHQLMAEARMAGQILGVKDVLFLSLKMGELAYDRRSIDAVDRLVQHYAPHSIFTHWIGDTQPDRVNLTRCVIAATRRCCFNVYMYEQCFPGEISPAAFHAKYVVDIDGHLDKKLESVRAHRSQTVSNGLGSIDGIRGYAMYRGFQIGKKFAEAFDVISICNDTDLFVEQLESSCSGVPELNAEISVALP